MEDFIYKHRGVTSDYVKVFPSTLKFLKDLGVENPLCHELHIPSIIDKDNFIVMMRDERIQKFREDHRIFLKRTIYHNLYPSRLPPRELRDPKVAIDKDATSEHLRQEWLSVRDRVVDNPARYPIITNYLKQEFAQKCIFER